jgi:hypothetical protein
VTGSVRGVVVIVGAVNDFLAPSVDDDSFREFGLWGTVSSSTEVENFNVCQIVALDCGDTSAIIELDLPHATEICEEVADTFAGSHVPHFQGAIGARDHFLVIVLEAGDGAGVCAQCVLAVAVHRVPDAKGGIGGGRHKEVVLQGKEADEGGVAFKVVEDCSVVQ